MKGGTCTILKSIVYSCTHQPSHLEKHSTFICVMGGLDLLIRRITAYELMDVHRGNERWQQASKLKKILIKSSIHKCCEMLRYTNVLERLLCGQSCSRTATISDVFRV